MTLRCLKAEIASKERSLAEKDSAIAESKLRIACFEKELAKSKGANVDANHKVELGAPPLEVLRRRNSAETTEVLTRFGARLENLKLNIDRLPKKGQTAVNYAVNKQSRVFRRREDADYELDNNWCERAARSYALSRKTSFTPPRTAAQGHGQSRGPLWRPASSRESGS